MKVLGHFTQCAGIGDVRGGGGCVKGAITSARIFVLSMRTSINFDH